ncbi:MAG: Hpt domain-containing protein [Myxococcota bacterium]
MTSDRRELDQLLAGEIERRRALVERPETQLIDLRAALHSLKGSAGLAGYPELALVLGQLSARLRQGDGEARNDLIALLALASARLSAGEPPFPTIWPEPPPCLRPSSVEARYRAEYRTTMRERLGEIDAVLSSHDSAVLGLERAERCVHAMKGAASIAGDDVTSWYCHGLEERLRAAARTEPSARDVLVGLGRHRALLALMIDDPSRGLATLEALAKETRARRAPSVLPPPEPSRPLRSSPPASEPPPDAGFHVAPSALDGFAERLDRVELVHGELGRASLATRRLSGRLREVRASLSEALRTLGPPRPWGPPLSAVDRIESAANTLRNLTASTERGAHVFRRTADFLRARSDEMRADLAALQRTSVGSVFERVARAGLRLAEAESRLLRVQLVGADLRIDRRVAEKLYDALVPLVRNAVAHGVEPPEQRTRLGKSPVATLTLRAERHAERLRVTVEDDGQGPDVDGIRDQAVSHGALSPERAASASVNELLALLFLPGLTTHDGPGLLAGLGLGLELVQQAVRALGGNVRLESREGGGFVATLDFPNEQALMEVLWVVEGGDELALPVNFTRGIRSVEAERAPVRLSRCLGRRAARPASLEVELAVHGVEPIGIGVDNVGVIEEVTVRPVPSLIAAAGPYFGAILRSDGSLRLALDVPLLVARVWAAA